jgi:hypothetical protein
MTAAYPFVIERFNANIVLIRQLPFPTIALSFVARAGWPQAISTMARVVFSRWEQFSFRGT